MIISKNGNKIKKNSKKKTYCTPLIKKIGDVNDFTKGPIDGSEADDSGYVTGTYS